MTDAPAMLRIEGDDGRSWRATLKNYPLVIGRLPPADITLADDTVSRRHAELFRDPFGRWWIRDLGSRNGVKVAKRRVSEHLLVQDETIRVGIFNLSLVLPQISANTLGDDSHQSVELADGTEHRFSTYDDLAPPRITAGLLEQITDLGRTLLETADAGERARLLCALFISRTLQGDAALLLRVSTEPDAAGDAGSCAAPVPPPQLLACEMAAPDSMLHISRTLLRKLVQSRRPVLASNAPRGPRGPDDAIGLSIDQQEAKLAAAACPMDEPPGAASIDVFYVQLPPHCGTAEWLALVSLGAKQYQQAEQVWAARKRAEANVALERELKKASEIQSRLIPKPLRIGHLDVVTGFRPCRWVGGDYADIVPLPDGRVLLVLADVCGKGLQAALVTMQLHTAVRAAVRSAQGLEELVAQLNDHLCCHLPDWSFVTLVAIVVDPSNGAITCVNAGHPPVLLVNGDGPVRRLQSGTHFPLGMMPQSFECEHDRIDPGQLLVLYTDGLTDLTTGNGEMLGIEGVERMLAAACAQAETASSRDGCAAECCHRLTGALDRMRGGTLAADDETFLMARMLPLGSAIA